MLLALAMIVAIVGGVGLTGSLAISVIERTKEIGVLRAIGGRSRTIQGHVRAGRGAAGNNQLGSRRAALDRRSAGRWRIPWARPCFRQSDLPYNYQAVGVWLIVILLMSVLASVIPARNARHVSVRESLAYE